MYLSSALTLDRYNIMKYRTISIIIVIALIVYLVLMKNEILVHYDLHEYFHDTTQIDDTIVVTSRSLSGRRYVDTLLVQADGFHLTLASVEMTKNGVVTHYSRSDNGELQEYWNWTRDGALLSHSITSRTESSVPEMISTLTYGASGSLLHFHIRVCDSDGVILSDRTFRSDSSEIKYGKGYSSDISIEKALKKIGL